MLASFSLILMVGLSLSALFNHLKLPGLIGMILGGILLGPYIFNLLSAEILAISADLRQIALIVILIRAGLSLNISDLKKNGRPAALMSFLPACFEILIITVLAPIFFKISFLEGAIMGAVVSAVSPAVIVPRMLNLIEKGYGHKRKVPLFIMTCASLDDIFVIVLFTSLTKLYLGLGTNHLDFLNVPLSLILGVCVGIFTGRLACLLFEKFTLTHTEKVIFILSLSFLVVALEARVASFFPYSALLAVMTIGHVIYRQNKELIAPVKESFKNIWRGAEVILFVLVGAALDITGVPETFLSALILIFIALIFRVVGVYMSLIKSTFNNKERLFCAISFTPKATVQAAIGSVPLALGVKSGGLILTVAVISILLTAPFGAASIDYLAQRLLSKD